MSMLPDPETKIRALEAQLRERDRRIVGLLESGRELLAELADLRASSVVVRRKCETCDGRGWVLEWAQPDEKRVPCPDCVDGWRLIEGVRERIWWCRVGDRNPDHPIDGVWTGTLGDPQRCWYRGEHDSRCGWVYVIPARLIEGDT